MGRVTWGASHSAMLGGFKKKVATMSSEVPSWTSISLRMLLKGHLLGHRWFGILIY